MRAVDEDALICDFMEYYHIPDIWSMDIQQVAVLAAGLPPGSRIKRKLTGSRVSQEEILLGMIADGINTLIWFQTDDGHKGVNRPASVVDKLLGRQEKDNDSEFMTYRSAEEFERARAELMGG